MMAPTLWSVLIACVMYLHLGCVTGDYERRCTVDDRLASPRGICGRHLSQAMALICEGSYQTPAFMSTIQEWSKRSAEEQIWNDKVFLPKSKALSYLEHKRGSYDASRVGIVCECCTYKCSLNEMLQYCYGGSGMGKRAESGMTRIAPDVMTWKSTADASKNRDLQALGTTTTTLPLPHPGQPTTKQQEAADFKQEVRNEHAQGETGSDAMQEVKSYTQDATNGKENDKVEDEQTNISELVLQLLKMFPAKKV